MKTIEKNNVIRRLNKFESVIYGNGTRYIIADRRKNNPGDVVDWAFSVFQRGIADKKKSDTLLSDPTDVIEIAKEIGVGFYITTGKLDGEGFDVPYIRLY